MEFDLTNVLGPLIIVCWDTCPINKIRSNNLADGAASCILLQMLNSNKHCSLHYLLLI
jgi:hypothetical protein